MVSDLTLYRTYNEIQAEPKGLLWLCTLTLFITPQKCKADEAWCFQQLAITILPDFLEVLGVLRLDLH